MVRNLTYFNNSENPSTLARSVTITLTDGSFGSDSAGTEINVAAVNDPAIANNDAVITLESSATDGDLFADNGSGPDSDPDGTIVVTAVNGSGASVGTQITLASGALLTVNADGTFSYDPNGAFDATPVAGSGASNTPASDTFQYTITGGDTATVSISLVGLDTDDTLLGTSGADVLDGGIGANSMSAGLGNDIYYVDNAGDVVVENSGGGSDLVYTSITYTLGNDIERLSVIDTTATDAIDLNGNNLANELIGNDGGNVLNGGAGADIMIGHGGNDFFIIDGGDLVVEEAGDGLDTVFTSVSHTLSANFERLGVNGFTTTFAINLTGNGLDNEMWGNDGANTLNGGAGADIMNGFGGNDFFIVDHAGDVVVEQSGNGLDTVFTSIGYTLGNHVERLGVNGFTTTFAINLTGNGLDNEMWGNDGANILDGGAGTDIMNGFGGNDFFIVDHAGDVVVEQPGAGLDTVYTSIGYTLGNNVERLGVNGFTTTFAINLTGNGLDNEMWGNDGVNILNGGAGADIMNGFGGNDFYIVDTAADVVNERSGGGFDTVFTSDGYTLGDDVERLSVNGVTTTFGINLTGNALANEITGNDGGNLLDGRGGSDILYGRAGADIFAFTTSIFAGTIDQMPDFQAGIDRIWIDNAEFAGLSPGALAADAFTTGSSAQDAADRIIYNPVTGALLFDADGTGAGAAVQFATLPSGTPLSASDFEVI